MENTKGNYEKRKRGEVKGRDSNELEKAKEDAVVKEREDSNRMDTWWLWIGVEDARIMEGSVNTMEVKDGADGILSSGYYSVD